MNMINHRLVGRAMLIFCIAVSVFFIFRPVSVHAVETADVIYPEANYWKPTSFGTAFRVPGDLIGIQGSPVGSVVIQSPGYDSDTEIITGPSFGGLPTVRVFRGDGMLRLSFSAYDSGMRHGVNVASGDVDGDGKAEIITGTKPGAVAHVVIYDNQGKMDVIAGGFFPFGRESAGGVSVATGDVDGDGIQEIITAVASDGEPTVKVWKKSFSTPIAEFLAFDKEMVSGVSVTTGDVDGDGRDEILVAPAGKGGHTVRIFRLSDVSKPYGEIEVADDYVSGLNLTSSDIDGDGIDEIVVAPNGPDSSTVSAFDRFGNLKTSFDTSSVAYAGGWLVAAGYLSVTDSELILVLPADQDMAARLTSPKLISISISNQELHAYEYGHEVNSFLVSTGTTRHPTPLGTFSVLAKLPYVHYMWSYGMDHPDNYDLGLVPWNLRFLPHLYIHYAPWHNNFGRRISHGCVNVSLDNIKWIYEWAEVGVPVIVSE